MDSPALDGLTVGIIGTGNMGMAMLARLRALGVRVVCHDIDAARRREAAALGAQVAHDAQAVHAACDVLVVAVVDALQTEAVCPTKPRASGRSSLAERERPPAAVLLCPTIAPAAVERLAARLEALGWGAVDAPMSGGPQRARDGTMSLMLAGRAALLDAWAPLLAALAARRFVVSARPGDAARMKLVNNLQAAINLAGAAECLALARRLGLDGEQTLDVVAASSGQNWIGDDRLRRALAGDRSPRAHLRLLAKDSALALEAAAAAGFAPALGACAAQIFRAACAAGWQQRDDAALLEWFEGAPTPPATPASLAPVPGAGDGA
jgi:3-hydroxyisobutyrate dehydrogenase